MYGNIDINLDEEEGEGFLRRLYNVLLIKSIDNPVSLEMEPELGVDYEEEKVTWNGYLPGEDRYCNCCGDLLVVEKNIRRNKLEGRNHICTPCSNKEKQARKKGVKDPLTKLFKTRFCYMCGCSLSESNCHSMRADYKYRRHLCDGCREEIRNNWYNSEHRCIHCAVPLERGKNWHEHMYKQRTHICIPCRRNQVNNG